MIQEFVDRFLAKKPELESVFTAKHPDDYREIIADVVKVISDGHEYGSPDPERIHEIDDGSYQGVIVFVIAGKGYHPSDYWYVKISYGSCPGCDTLQAIRDNSNDTPTPDQVSDYMTLSLHVVEAIRKMGDDSV